LEAVTNALSLELTDENDKDKQFSKFFNSIKEKVVNLSELEIIMKSHDEKSLAVKTLEQGDMHKVFAYCKKKNKDCFIKSDIKDLIRIATTNECIQEPKYPDKDRPDLDDL
jgi:hypothetical protein